MQQKIKSSVGSGAQTNDNTESSLFDKYVALQKENQKLKQVCDALSGYWKWTAIAAAVCGAVR